MSLEEETHDEYWRFARRGMYEAAERENIDLNNVIRIQDGFDPQELIKSDAVIIIGTVTEDAVKKSNTIIPIWLLLMAAVIITAW